MLKNLPIVLLGIVLIAIVSVSCYTDPRNQDEQKGANHGTPGTSVTENGAGYSAQEVHIPKRTPIWRILLGWPEGVTTLAVLLTLFFIAWQAILMRQSVTASEEVAKRELRAYLTVVIGAAIFQERRPVEDGGDLMFECRPLIVNNGQTPARKVTFKARAAIIRHLALKETYLPEDPDAGSGGSIIGPRQDANMFAVVEGFCPDEEVNDIKLGTGDRGLFVWGKVTYEDVFGDEHFTRFCQRIYWDATGNVRGNYIPGRNDAT
jgi:hypothetical protein